MRTRYRLAHTPVRTGQRVGHTRADSDAARSFPAKGGICRQPCGQLLCSLSCQHQCVQHAVVSARAGMQDAVVSASVCPTPHPCQHKCVQRLILSAQVCIEIHVVSTRVYSTRWIASKSVCNTLSSPHECVQHAIVSAQLCIEDAVVSARVRCSVSNLVVNISSVSNSVFNRRFGDSKVCSMPYHICRTVLNRMSCPHGCTQHVSWTAKGGLEAERRG